MATIKFEAFDALRHRDMMAPVSTGLLRQHLASPTLVHHIVCLVTVAGFTFVFHSIEQVRACLEYYSREHHPSSRLPVYTGNYGGDQSETQRWFERLPQNLLEKPKRAKVVSALEQAISEYAAALKP
jgi:hypothetical protein